MSARGVILRFVGATTAYVAVALCIMFIALTARVILALPGDPEAPAACALVFGAAVHAVKDAEGNVVGSVPGPGILRRVWTAADLYNRGLVDRLILTGGKGEGMRRSEALVMREVALERGVDQADILMEERARSTWENLVYARPLVDNCASVVGISDAYHLARIEYLAERQGWGELHTIPSEITPNVLFLARSVAREVLAMLYYMLT